MIYFRPRYKKLDEEKSALRKVASLRNSTLFFWVSCSGTNNYLSDAKDVVVFAEVGKGKVAKLGEGEEMNNDQSKPRTSMTKKIHGNSEDSSI